MRRLVLVLLLSSIAAGASAQTKAVLVRNQTDRWAWMTAIGYVKKTFGGSYDNIAAWCVNPRSDLTKNNFSTDVQSVRVELTTGKNCAHPVVYDVTRTNMPRSRETEFLISQTTCGGLNKTCYRTRVQTSIGYNAKPSGMRK